ncbi:MAG: hypothetical protein RLY72_2601 [Planctomycetota bacterium]
MRTFGFAGFIGGLSALLTPAGATPWALIVVSALLGGAGAAGGIVTARRIANSQEEGREPFPEIGLTTAFALIATTLLGGYAVLGDRAIAVAAAGVVFLLLYMRDPLHALIRRLGQEDVRAIATFVLIALVILPVLPDRAMGPFDAINPRGAWLLVVLVVAMSLVGYIAQALLGLRAGTLATGLLGGLVSSTATTLGAARRARDDGAAPMSATIALLACGMLPLRLLVLVGVGSPAMLRTVWPWFAAIAGVTLLGALASLRRAQGMTADAQGMTADAQGMTADAQGMTADAQGMTKPKNPTQLKSALAFAGAFVVIRVATKATLVYAGMSVFLLVAAVSGITDMDAIALSAADESMHGLLTPHQAARAALVALLVNTLFKLGIARVAGSREMLAAMLPALGAAALLATVGAFLV